MTAPSLQFRSNLLARLGATPAVREELLDYNAAPLQDGVVPDPGPFDDEPFVAEWQGYAADVSTAGSIAVLARHLVQLRFPIQAGISATPEYLSATRRGRTNRVACSPLSAPQSCRVTLWETPAGRVPAIVAGERADFVTLVRAFTAKNEPVDVPESMGACVVARYNNWSRICRIQQGWLASNSPSGWPAEFARIRLDPRQYQDTFFILSSGPYSAVPAASLDLSESEWTGLSVSLRAEHESAHYFMNRAVGAMKTRLLDELIADFYAIARVLGGFRASFMLRFFGLEGSVYRVGGRLENYRGTLSAAAFAVLQELVRRAAFNLEEFGAGLPRPLVAHSGAHAIQVLSRFSVEELAAGVSLNSAMQFPWAGEPQLAQAQAS